MARRLPGGRRRRLGMVGRLHLPRRRRHHQHHVALPGRHRRVDDRRRVRRPRWGARRRGFHRRIRLHRHRTLRGKKMIVHERDEWLAGYQVAAGEGSAWWGDFTFPADDAITNITWHYPGGTVALTIAGEYAARAGVLVGAGFTAVFDYIAIGH